MNGAEQSLTVFPTGGGRVTVALGEAGYIHSRGAWIMSVPIVRYDAEGNWADGGYVYTTFDHAGLMDEAVRWADGSVRTAHNMGEGT
jgi:hypothetical protein